MMLAVAYHMVPTTRQERPFRDEDIAHDEIQSGYQSHSVRGSEVHPKVHSTQLDIHFIRPVSKTSQMFGKQRETTGGRKRVDKVTGDLIRIDCRNGQAKATKE